MEELEARRVFASTVLAPTAHEQLLLELINRARQDPPAEVARVNVPGGLNAGLPANTITPSPKQPLAFNLPLMNAAQAHTSWLFSIDELDHCGPNRAFTGPNNAKNCVEGWQHRMANANYAVLKHVQFG